MKFLYSEDSVRGKCCWIEVWMIDQHLLDISPRALCVDDREVCPEIIERRVDRIDLVTKAIPHKSGCDCRSAGVIVGNA